MPTLERMGKVGAWTGQLAALPHPQVRRAAAHIEDLGLGALWYGEAFGREAMALGGLILESTESLIAASGIASLFLSMPGLSLAVSAMFVLLMSGLILYQTSQIVHGGETNYIMATVTLYVSIYNLFTSLLHLLGAFSNE